MDRTTVVLKLSSTETRVLVHQGPDEMLRAVLPPLSYLRHATAVRLFLEGLALWTDQRLRVVLPADALDVSFSLDLTDELGVGVQSLYFDVEVAMPRRRRPVRLRGVGDFRDVRQLLFREVV